MFQHVSVVHFFLAEQRMNIEFFIHYRMCMNCMNIEFLVHSSVDRHLDCFQFQTITNEDARNFHIHIFVWTYDFFGGRNILEVELLNYVVNSCLTFLEITELFSKVAVPFYISTSSVWGFHIVQIFTSSTILGMVFHFYCRLFVCFQ